MEYIEGSLLDWQLGDLVPACTAGDIRVSYRITDPVEISVIGSAGPGKDGHELGIFLTSKKVSGSVNAFLYVCMYVCTYVCMYVCMCRGT